MLIKTQPQKGNCQQMTAIAIKTALEALKTKIKDTQATCEDYYLYLVGCCGKTAIQFSITIEYETDDFDEISINGLIPKSEICPLLANAEDDDELYRGVDVKDFLANCKWTAVFYRIRKQ